MGWVESDFRCSATLRSTLLRQFWRHSDGIFSSLGPSYLNSRRVDTEAARDGREGLADDARALLAEGHLGQPGFDPGGEHETGDEERDEEDGGVP